MDAQEQGRIDAIRFTTTSPGWTEYIAKDLQGEELKAFEVLARELHERGQNPHSDDWIKGYIRGLRYAHLRPGVLVEEAEAQRLKEEQEAANPAKDVGSPYAEPEQA